MVKWHLTVLLDIAKIFPFSYSSVQSDNNLGYNEKNSQTLRNQKHFEKYNSFVWAYMPHSNTVATAQLPPRGDLKRCRKAKYRRQLLQTCRDKYRLQS